LVSIVLLGTAMGAMLGAFTIARISIAKAYHHLEAMNLLRRRAEELKDVLYIDLATITAVPIILDIGPDLTSGTSDDLSGTILVQVRDKDDLDGDENTTETEIDIDDDGTNDPCKPVYITISWTSTSWGIGSKTVSEELATLINNVSE
jgi:hypothetical protein